MKPAVRELDPLLCEKHGGLGDVAALGQPNVRINGRPAIRLGDQANCPFGGADVVGEGAALVRIGGVPAAVVGHKSMHAAPIGSGSHNVTIRKQKGFGKGVDHHLTGDPAVDSDEFGVGVVLITAWASEHLAGAIRCVAGLMLSVGCLACADTTSDAGRSAEVKPRSALPDSCRSAVRPKDALREITAQLELAVWEDPVCNALNVEIVNLSSTPLQVLDEKLRWAVEDDQLRVEPVPEQSAGQPRSYNRGCCQQLIVDKGKWAVLPPLGSFRWSEPLHDVETDDTRALCDGFAPSFYDAPLIFSSVSVVVSAFPLDGFPSRPPYQVDALCALRAPIEVRAFERQLPVEYWRE